MTDLAKKIPQIEEKLCYKFKDSSLLLLALTHCSYVNEHPEVTSHNERLEFLGDSVLGMIMAEYLYNHLPHHPEGELSAFRSRLVESSSCVTYIQKMSIGSFILLGKGERMSVGRGRETILADLFEAVIGAIYLDGGLEAAKHFILNNCAAEIEAILEMPVNNWKALLQDYCQKKFQKTPTYQVIKEEGPDHGKLFKISVSIEDKVLGFGEGTSKKIAQQAAAADALSRISPKNP